VALKVSHDKQILIKLVKVRILRITGCCDVRQKGQKMQTYRKSTEFMEIVTTKQAADMLGVSVSTVQKWVELGKLASWKTPGGHRRIPITSIKAVLLNSYAEMHSTPATAGFENSESLPRQDIPVRPKEGVDEAVRLLATRTTRLLDTAADAHYDRLVRIAALVTNMPIALISLLDEQRQWFKSRIGLSVTQTPRSWAFCNYTILDNKIMVVEDATKDPRFEHNPLVIGYEAIRFYAGVPLVDENECRLGTLCVLDRVPRRLTHDQTWSLTELASIVSEQIQRKV
jgi:excisionase family DNA binding protein